MMHLTIPPRGDTQLKCEVSLEDHFFGTATVGERGQIVIPAEARKRFDIHPGDKVLVMGHPSASGVMLCKIDAMREFFTSFLTGLERLESEVARSESGEEEASER